MLFGPGRWCWKVGGIGKLLREVVGDLGERPEFRRGHGLEQDIVPLLFDANFRALEAEGPRQADGLATTVLEDFGGDHS